MESWFLPSLIDADAPAPALVFAHGNGELIDHIVQFVEPARALGFAVLLVEFPGYGRSQGSPSRQSIMEAFEVGYDWLVEQDDVDCDKVVFFGRSMGGAVACELASARPGVALVLLSTFTDLPSMSTGFLLPGFLVRDRFDCAAILREHDGPVLIFHGDRDSMVPFHHGQGLYSVAKNAEFVELSCDHNDCPPETAAFWDTVTRFLESSAGLTVPSSDEQSTYR